MPSERRLGKENCCFCHKTHKKNNFDKSTSPNLPLNLPSLLLPIMIFSSLLALAALTVIPPVYGAGCYPAWSSGSDYSNGSFISATITSTSTPTASDGTTTETTTSETKNFKCTHGSEPSLSHCPSYNPSNAVQQAAAWSDEGVCSGTASALKAPLPTTKKPTLSRWTNTGCPEEWTSGGRSTWEATLWSLMEMSTLARPQQVPVFGAVLRHTSQETQERGSRGHSPYHLSCLRRLVRCKWMPSTV